MLRNWFHPIFIKACFAGLLLSAMLGVRAQGPMGPSCGNISIIADAMIDGRLFQKGEYQLNSFGIPCAEVVGSDGILGVILSLKETDKLPPPWASLSDAIGAPKFAAGAGIGFRLQKVADLSLVAVPLTSSAGVSTKASTGSTAIFSIGASSNRGVTSGHSFTSADALEISGAVTAQSEDRLRAANIYVVAKIDSATPYFMSLSRLGTWGVWSGAVKELTPAYTVPQLETELRFPIYSGKLPGGSTVAIFVGYSIISAGTDMPVHYNSTPYNISVQ
jgi:hypothetical protein